MKSVSGRVYVMATEDDDVLKIGYSVLPRQRMRAVGCKAVLHETAFYENAYLIEQAAHGALAAHGLGNELFRVGLDAAKAAIAHAEARTPTIEPPPPTRNINIRVDPDMEVLIDDMCRQKTPIPTVSQLMRQALVEKAERDLKRGVRR